MRADNSGKVCICCMYFATKKRLTMSEQVMLGAGDPFLHLGQKICDEYVIHSSTAATLEKMNRRLNEDDTTMRNYRRALAFSNVIEKDLIPIFLSCKDDPLVMDSVLKLLVNLTLPIQCLFPTDLDNLGSSVKHTVILLNSVLAKTKVLCSNTQFSWVVMKQLSALMRVGAESAENISTIHNLLLLIRNILHIPEQSRNDQNQLIWYLFSYNLDKVLLNLICHKSGAVWSSTIVHIIAILFKDQHVETLARLLDTALLESSEDGESNTTPSPNMRGSQGAQDSSDLISDENNHQMKTLQDDFEAFVGTSESVSSLEVFPTASPAPSITSLADLGAELEQHFLEQDIWGNQRRIETDIPAMTERNKLDTNTGKHKSSLKKTNSTKAEDSTTSGIESMEIKSEPSKAGYRIPQVCWSNYIEESSDEDPEYGGSHHAIHGREDAMMDGIETAEGEPPAKKVLLENASLHHIHFSRNHRQATHLFHKEAKPQSEQKDGSGSESSETTGVPKTKTTMAGGAAVGFISNIDAQLQGAVEDSTSSNDDDNQRPPRAHPAKPKPRPGPPANAKMKSKQKRLKLLKQILENRFRVPAMKNIAEDKDIAELLKEFTVAFLMTGYSRLVQDLRHILVANHSSSSPDDSHLLWLITYFLQFASQLEIGLEHIGDVLSLETIAFVTFQGVEVVEILELASRERTADTSSHLRRVHLVVIAVREFLTTLNNYTNLKHLDQSDKDHLATLQQDIAGMKGLRQLLLLLLRTYKDDAQSVQYLSDLIVCNNLVLSNMGTETPAEQVNLLNHVSQFANTELMRQYGRLLSEYKHNSVQVNDCIFTMMHHVAGDLGAPHTLHIPAVLNTFSTIWEEDLDVCEDWVDLIEYVIQKFVQTMATNPHSCAANIIDCMDSSEVLDEYGMTGSQAAQLFWNFSQVENTVDPVGALLESYRQTDNITFSRLAVIQSLLSHGIITHAKYMNFIYMKSVIPHCNIDHEESVIAEVGSVHSEGLITDEEMDTRETSAIQPITNSQSMMTQSVINQPDNHNGSDSRQLASSPARPSLNNREETTFITKSNKQQGVHESEEAAVNKEMKEMNVLKDCIIKQGRHCLITWLQEVLIDACRIKLNPSSILPEGSSIAEPVPFYYNSAMQSIPLVPFNRSQHQGLQTESFILLLHKLGFFLPADVGKAYPRIPYFWTADHLYAVALKLGPLHTTEFGLNATELEKLNLKVVEAGWEEEKEEQGRFCSKEEDQGRDRWREQDTTTPTSEDKSLPSPHFMDMDMMDLDLLGREGEGEEEVSWLHLARISAGR